MFFEKLRKTLELNKIKIEFPGKKIFYDKIILWIAITSSILLIVLCIVFCAINQEWWFLIGIPIFLLPVPSIVRKLLFKNPVFIFQKDKFYYSLENRWFDKNNCTVSYRTPQKFSVIIIRSLNDSIEIEETVSQLDDATEFRREINQYSSNKSLLTLIEHWNSKK